jgi:hypothetical protein
MTRKFQKGSLLFMGKAVLILSKNLHIFTEGNAMRTKDERASQAFVATFSGNGCGHELLPLCGIDVSCRGSSSPQYTAGPQGPEEADLSSEKSAGLRFLSVPPFCFKSGVASSGDSGVSPGDSPALVSASG